MSYDSVVAADTPQAWFKLADTSGTTAPVDSSGNGYTAAATAVTFGEASFMAGNPGDTCALFDGTSSTILTDCGNASWGSGGAAFSVEAWLDLASSSEYGMLVGNGDTYNAGAAWWLGLDPYGNPDAQGSPEFLAAGAGFDPAVQPGALAPGVYHLVGTWDGSTSRLYVNGALGGSHASSAVHAGGFIGIGYNPATSPPYYLAAKIAEVAIYQYALSPTQVAAHYTAGNPPAAAADPIMMVV